METIEQILQSIAELRIAQKESHRELAEQMKATDARMAKLHAETEEFFKASDARFEARLEKSRLEEAEKRRADDEKQRIYDEKRRVEWQERTLEFDKEMKELAASQKETNKQLGGIGNSNGAYAENFFYQSLKNKMQLGSVKFDEIEKNLKFKRKGLVDEFDTILYNGDSIGLVETKYMVSSANIKQLINTKPQNFKTLCPDYATYKIYLGIAGFSFENDKVKQEAINAGVAVLEAVGDHVEINASNLKAY